FFSSVRSLSLPCLLLSPLPPRFLSRRRLALLVRLPRLLLGVLVGGLLGGLLGRLLGGLLRRTLRGLAGRLLGGLLGGLLRDLLLRDLLGYLLLGDLPGGGLLRRFPGRLLGDLLLCSFLRGHVMALLVSGTCSTTAQFKRRAGVGPAHYRRRARRAGTDSEGTTRSGIRGPGNAKTPAARSVAGVGSEGRWFSQRRRCLH